MSRWIAEATGIVHNTIWNSYTVWLQWLLIPNVIVLNIHVFREAKAPKKRHYWIKEEKKWKKLKSLRHGLLLFLFDTHIWQIMNEKKNYFHCKRWKPVQHVRCTSLIRSTHIIRHISAHRFVTIADISYLFNFIYCIAFGKAFLTNGIVIGIIHQQLINEPTNEWRNDTDDEDELELLLYTFSFINYNFGINLESWLGLTELFTLFDLYQLILFSVYYDGLIDDAQILFRNATHSLTYKMCRNIREFRIICTQKPTLMLIHIDSVLV